MCELSVTGRDDRRLDSVCLFCSPLRYGELSVAERSKLFLLLLSVKNCFTTYSLDRRWKNFRISLCDEISF